MIQREKRKTYARAFTLLGFGINELTSILGVSSNTIKTYLKETQGTVYSDLDEFIYYPDVFPYFTERERELLNSVKQAKEKGKQLSAESHRTHNISKGKGFQGWISKNILKDCEKYERMNDEVSKEMNNLKKELELTVKRLKDPKQAPHFSKVKFDIESSIQVKES